MSSSCIPSTGWRVFQFSFSPVNVLPTCFSPFKCVTWLQITNFFSFGGKVVGLLFCGCFCLFVFGCYCCFCCSPLLRERRCKICRHTIVMLKNGELFLLRVYTKGMCVCVCVCVCVFVCVCVGKPHMLLFIGLQWVGHNLATEQQHIYTPVSSDVEFYQK